MIVVTGASGRLGRLIVERLLERLPAANIGASVRDPAKVDDFAGRGVRVRRGDFAEPSTLRSAFEGAAQLLLVSSNARAQGGDAITQHRDAIAAARAAGVRRIVYTSHMGAGAASAFPPMHDHAATETMLAACGLAWTALRNGLYASTVPMLVGDAVTSGVLAAPADGKVSWTAHRDLAEAAAAILLSEDMSDGPTPPLTASRALDLADVAALLSELRDRPMSRAVIGEDEQTRRMAAHGAPPAVVETSLSLFRAARAGEFATVDPTLATLLAREPITVREVLARGDG